MGTDDRTRKVVGYTDNGLALWLKYVNQNYWFHDNLENILTKRLGLSLSLETIKQLDAHRGDLDFVYRIAELCRNQPDHDGIIRAHLAHPHIPIHRLKGVFTQLHSCTTLKGARFRATVDDYAERYKTEGERAVILLTQEAGSDAYAKTVDEVLAEHKDKLGGESGKIVNFLVGQVMKKLPDRKGVDVAAIKALLIEKVGTA